VLVIFVVAYTFSLIDLIPDFIPVLGSLDDLIITPLGLALAIRMIPAEVLEEARSKVAGSSVERSVKVIGIVVIGLTWVVILILIIRLIQFLS
jgi:uncharacterized membrane protein YkvA (DUF1232 family)